MVCQHLQELRVFNMIIMEVGIRCGKLFRQQKGNIKLKIVGVDYIWELLMLLNLMALYVCKWKMMEVTILDGTFW